MLSIKISFRGGYSIEYLLHREDYVVQKIEMQEYKSVVAGRTPTTAFKDSLREIITANRSIS